MTEENYDVRTFLRSVREARMEQRQCERRLDELRSQCERVTAAYGPLTPGGGGDVHKDSLLIAVAEQGEELLEKTKRCVRQVAWVDEFIAGLPDARHRAILRLRYISLLRWDAVRYGMQEVGLYYAERHIYKLHGAALQEARRLWPEYLERHPEIRPRKYYEEGQGDVDR